MSAIEKYGFDNFQISERFDIAFSSSELDEKEKYWISYFKSDLPHFGYNQESGGNPNKIVPQKTRELQSQSQINRFRNPESREYLRCRKHSEETKRKISESKRGAVGHPMPEYNLDKLNEAKRKPIVCITTGETFYYMKDALKKYNIKSHGSLSLACNGKRKHCGTLADGTKLEWRMWGVD
jgi:hypothetical protein